MNDLSEMKMEYCTVVDLMYEYFQKEWSSLCRLCTNHYSCMAIILYRTGCLFSVMLYSITHQAIHHQTSWRMRKRRAKEDVGTV